MNKLTIVHVPDENWEGLYVNGQLEYQHKIRIKDLVDYCPIGEINEMFYENFDSESFSGLPLLLSEIIEGGGQIE